MKLKSLMLKEGIRLVPPPGAPTEVMAMYTRPVQHFRPEHAAEMSYDPITQLVTLKIRDMVRLVHAGQVVWMEPEALPESSGIADVLKLPTKRARKDANGPASV